MDFYHLQIGALVGQEVWGRALAHRSSRFQDKVPQSMPFESHSGHAGARLTRHMSFRLCREACFAAATRLFNSKLRMLKRQHLLRNNFFHFSQILKPGSRKSFVHGSGRSIGPMNGQIPKRRDHSNTYNENISGLSESFSRGQPVHPRARIFIDRSHVADSSTALG